MGRTVRRQAPGNVAVEPAGAVQVVRSQEDLAVRSVSVLSGITLGDTGGKENARTAAVTVDFRT